MRHHIRHSVVVILAFFLLLATSACSRKDKAKQNSSDISSVGDVQNHLNLQLHAPEFILKPSGTEYDSLVGDWIFDAIDDAWTALDKMDAGYKLVPQPEKIQPKPGRQNKRLKPAVKMVQKLQYNVLLAVIDLHSKDRKLEFVLVDEKGRPTMPGFSISKEGRARGVGTTYEVTAPTGYAVLAIKRVLKVEGEYQEVIYTPHSAALDVPLIRKAGYDYLVARISEAQADLRAKQVKSFAFPGKLVADIIPLRVSLALSVIEHVDPGDFAADTKTAILKNPRLSQDAAEKLVMEKLANKALVVVGANDSLSYCYAVSRKAHARGLFQFIRRTYDSIQKKYKTAGLKKDFVDGMDDHTNGAKASLLLFDSDWSFLHTDRRAFLQKNPDALGMYLAASYNGGPGRASGAIANYGDKWPQHVLAETQVYVRKFRALEAAFYSK